MNFGEKIILGKTGLQVGRLGISSSFGPPSEVFDAAFDRGCTYFTWGTFIKGSSSEMKKSIIRITRNGRRDNLVLALNSYAHDPFLSEVKDRPGIVSYTATRWGQLLNPEKMPPGEKTPSAADCYRFVLSNPSVDVCMMGVKNRKQLEENLRVLNLGPMEAEELAWMRRVGDHICLK